MALSKMCYKKVKGDKNKCRTQTQRNAHAQKPQTQAYTHRHTRTHAHAKAHLLFSLHEYSPADQAHVAVMILLQAEQRCYP